MRALDLPADGFYWYRCPPDDGPERWRNRGWMPVKVVGIDVGNSNPLLLASGDPASYLLYNLPGEFQELPAPQ